MRNTLHQVSLLPQFTRLAIVNILSNLMVPLAGLIDVAFLGHLAEIRHLAGVSLATVLFNYIYWTFGFLRMSTTGMTAQAQGRDDRVSVMLIGWRHGVLALAIGVLLVLLQQPIAWVGFRWLSAEPDVKLAAQDYYQALIWGAPATLLNFVAIGWFLGQGQSHKVFLLSFITNVANVVLDYLLIVRFNWGSVGAGAATAIAQYLTVLVSLLLTIRSLDWIPLSVLKHQLFDRLAIKNALTLNREIVIRTLALVSTFAVFTNLSAGMGTIVLTTNAVLLQVVSLAAYFIDGLAFATETLAGIFHGQQAIDRLKQLVRVAGGISLALGLSIALLFILFPQVLFRPLTNHTAILDRIPDYVAWLFPILGFGSIAYLLDGYFLGLTAGRILRTSTVFATVLGFMPTAIGAWYFQSSHLLWLAMTLFMAVRALTLVLMLD